MDQSRVYPPPCLDRVQTAYNEVKLQVVVLGLILYLSKVSAMVRCLAIVIRNGTAYGVTFTPGTRFIINSAATVALGLPTSFCLRSNSAFILAVTGDTRT
jgi:hypothetical protein